MEGNDDPFIFRPDTPTDVETLDAIHMTHGDVLQNRPSSYLDHDIDGSRRYLQVPPLSDNAVTHWSNLQVAGISSPPNSASDHRSSHEAHMFQQSFPLHRQLQQEQSHVGNISSAIDGSNINSVLLNDTADANIAIEQSHKPGARMSRQTARALRDWESQYGEKAKPTIKQIHRLQRHKNLSQEEISNFFAHANRRNEASRAAASNHHLDKSGKNNNNKRDNSRSSRSSSSSTATTMPQSVLMTDRSGSEITRENQRTPRVQGVDHRSSTPVGDMDPMERWESSPPEQEAAHFRDITKALTHSGDSDLHNASNSPPSRTSMRSVSHGDSASTGSSVNNIGNPEASVSSPDSDIHSSNAYSDQSGKSPTIGGPSEYRRRARKRRTNPLSRKAELDTLRSNSTPKTFQCTFCTDSFKTKYDWSRHEKSLHLALESWTCSPFGNVYQEADGSEPKCVYCNAPSPTEEHLHTHRYLACDGRPESERTYYRKDHLRQHLRIVHGCRFIPSMERWKNTPEFVRSRCGFCDQYLTTWQARIDHLASHFRSGASMENWSGYWGFEPHVNRLVENGTPPFLIHQERSTGIPYSGPTSGSKNKDINKSSSKEKSLEQEAIDKRGEVQGKGNAHFNQPPFPATQDMSWYEYFEPGGLY